MITKRTALVTGANKGIGREIARQLGKKGFTVWLGCRDEGRGRKAEEELRAEGIDAHLVILDITEDASVRAAVEKVGQHTPHLDVLINNVGIGSGLGTQPSDENVGEIRAQFETNVFGTIRVTQAFLPLVRKATDARIVMMSSGLGSITLTADMKAPTWNLAAMGYSASKAALNMFTVKLAKELLTTGIKVNAACPGSVATDMGGPGAPRTVEQGAAIAIRLATLDWIGPTGGFFHDGDGPQIAPYGW
ncbi:SDR family oxidoreductase [Rhizobium sp. P38BS-XIX]|uniref:SDR family oxidoreductase n=1 Tax=Rhizobium sp. P38BS-XIX TaxID=2726740 RepID=UPI00145664D3|nr:SDR family oxidoreductase [Rhizobium sp. P38BS-XIX]NLR98078.1 SDR family oxidoreductase [Rhizobium sp. P38BS-XIX]